MNLDRNSVIGLVLLALLFFGYFYYTRQGQIELEAQRKRTEDSIARLKPKVDIVSKTLDSLRSDTLTKTASAGQFVNSSFGKEEIIVVENDLVKIGFSNKGGQPAFVQLKKYLSQDSTPVKVANSDFDRLTYRINNGQASTAETADLFFTPSGIVKNADGSQSITYSLLDSTGRTVRHAFVLPANEYMVNWTIQLDQVPQLLSKNSIDFTWQVKANQQEKDIVGERRETQVDILNADGFDYFTMKNGLAESWENGVKWMSIKQKFFNHTLIAKNGFSSAKVSATVPTSDTLHEVASATMNLTATIPAGQKAEIPLQFYFGPNEFKRLKSYNMEMEDMVNLGQGAYAFVKYINRAIVMPVFNIFSGFFGSFGLVIALLTIIIRLLTSPLIYSSYLSGAKMKALRPELDQLKQKFKDDQQAYSMEQMKLFRTAGVNPLGGCIPALLQIPIFFALYSFFNAEISLRGQSFWWAQDLSSYDKILSWSYDVPVISYVLGNHISLFTILAVVTSLLISIYSMSMTPDQDNPMLKYMPYIFPIMLLGIFNGLPAALTWYYTVSNIITLLMQFVIQNYIINHDKILAQIEENKKKPQSKPKWQEKLEAMQETQRKVNDMQNRTKKK
ncbi:MAG: membrane protein insertase YidC [Sphingobacteriales bacterium]